MPCSYLPNYEKPSDTICFLSHYYREGHYYHTVIDTTHPVLVRVTECISRGDLDKRLYVNLIPLGSDAPNVPVLLSDRYHGGTATEVSKNDLLTHLDMPHIYPSFQKVLET